MPAMRTAPRRSLTSAKAVLGTRSVVMMARAASSKRSGARPATSRGSASVILPRRRVPRRSRRWRRAAPAPPADFSSLAAALQVASATASPVRVAQLALPAFTRMAPARPRDSVQVAAAEPHRRGLHAVLREHGGGVGGKAADDQRQVVFFRLADAGVGGGVEISERQVQVRGSPRISFSVNRWPLAKSAADMRLRPSSCTSTSSRAPEPQLTIRRLQRCKLPGGQTGQARSRGRPRFPDVQRLAAERGVRARPGLQAAHAIVNRLRPGRLQSIRPSSFFSSGA